MVMGLGPFPVPTEQWAVATCPGHSRGTGTFRCVPLYGLSICSPVDYRSGSPSAQLSKNPRLQDESACPGGQTPE
jgi:hypothetical protein